MNDIDETPTPIAPGQGAPAQEKGDEQVEDITHVTVSPDPSHEMNLSILETIKANPKAITYCALLCFGPMVYGFDLIIVSLATAMPAFQ